METNKAAVHALMHQHATRLKSESLKSLVAQSERSEDLRIQTHGLYFDFSKHIIDQEALQSLSAYAKSCSIDKHVRAYFSRRKSMSPKTVLSCTPPCVAPHRIR